MKKTICVFCSVLLLVSMTLGLTACGAKNPQDLTHGVHANTPAVTGDSALADAAATDFALRLFRAAETDGENTLVSPLSVLCALAMTANGAKEETRSQMEAVLGMKTETLNGYLYTYLQSLRENDALHLANSIWFTDDDRFTVNGDFLQTNADYYGADLYKTPFDAAACKAINDWVKEETRGMIPEILDQIPPDAVMYLVNALAFEAKWEEVYMDYQVHEGDFDTADGQKRKADYMGSMEHAWLETDMATGFMKYYEGRQYAFAALLPNEGVTVTELLDSLTGAELHELLTHPKDAHVNTAIPKFETDYSAELKDVLSAMGMPVAFDSHKADFSGLGTSTGGNIFISRVLHKTFISVAEQGTKAGAATVVEMSDSALLIEETRTVTLDRPFVYMLVDVETGTPFFIGTMLDPAA
ncbi:MAG: serpin family protein [Oscillospiraceae bacterium]|nr:serpin family protein [Oscillospiraceae bacterium]